MWMMEFLQRLKKSLRRGRTAELPSDEKDAFYTLTPMVVAHQHKSVADLLSGSSFNVNFACGRSQRTLLHIAANCGTYECLSLLLKKGANPNAQDASGCTPLHLAARNGHRKCLNRLLESKADIHIHNKEGLTALHWLAVNGRAETLQDLLAHVTNVDIEDLQGQTALHIACQNGHITTMLCLLDHGASVNKKNHNGWTPLHFACSHGQHGAVEELLKRNAEVFFSETGPNSIMEICVERGYGDTCEVLLNHHPKLFKHLMQLMQHSHVMRQDSLVRVFSHLSAMDQAMRERVVGGLAEQASLIGHRLLSGTQDLEQESECLLRCVRTLTELQFLPQQRRDSGTTSPPQPSSRPIHPLPAHCLQHLSTLWLLLENWLCLISQELQDQGSVTEGCQGIPHTAKKSSATESSQQQSKSCQAAEEGAQEKASSNGAANEDRHSKLADSGDVHCCTADFSTPEMTEVSAAKAEEDQSEARDAATGTQSKQLQNRGAAAPSDSQKSHRRNSVPTSGAQDVTGNVVLNTIDRVCSVLQAMYLCSKISVEGEPPVHFEDFIQTHLHVLQKLVQREPSLIFRHFHFVLDMPGLMASFLPIIKAQPFETRREWFYANLPPVQTDLVPSRRDALEVHRDRLFHSSCEEILRRDPTMLMAELNVQFSGEDGVGHGVVREWFDTLSREILNPDYALFTQSADGRTFQPNSNSSINPDHLSYFKFAGQILGLALYHRYLLNIYFTRSFYKHILGIPVNYTDVASIDPEYAKNLQWILDHSIDELGLDLTFCVETDVFGVMQEVELKTGGSTIAVNNHNKAEYVQLVTELRMTQAIRRQIDSFLSGFHDYIPRSLIKMFDEYELELLLSGMPEIDLKDWQSHTLYTGYAADSPVIQWFWSVVEAMSEQTRVQLLQFVTGSSRVPYGGFAQLSSSGSSQLFTVCRTSHQPRSLPTASTCINLLKLPEYESQEELQERLLVALQCGSQGYGMV